MVNELYVAVGRSFHNERGSEGGRAVMGRGKSNGTQEIWEVAFSTCWVLP